MTVFAGDPILASDINGLLPANLLQKYKAADETVTNDTTLQNDDDLFFAIPASEVWGWEIMLLYSGTTTGDFKTSMTFPSGAVCPWGRVGVDTSLAASMIGFDAPVSGSSNFGFGGNGASNTMVARIAGTCINGANAGNVRLQWAMATSDSGQVARVRRGSHLRAWKVA